jgi:hypothetical protein
MREPKKTGQFKKDYKLMEKRQKDMSKIDEAITILIFMNEPEPIPIFFNALSSIFPIFFPCVLRLKRKYPLAPPKKQPFFPLKLVMGIDNIKSINSFAAWKPLLHKEIESPRCGDIRFTSYP